MLELFGPEPMCYLNLLRQGGTGAIPVMNSIIPPASQVPECLAVQFSHHPFFSQIKQ